MNKPSGHDRRGLIKARAGLTSALCVAASLALGGCASQPQSAPALPPAAVIDPAPEAPVSLNPAQIAALATPSVVAIRGRSSMAATMRRRIR
jgi:type IV pilus biogenesis protein CpaD/CtpE